MADHSPELAQPSAAVLSDDGGALAMAHLAAFIRTELDRKRQAKLSFSALDACGNVMHVAPDDPAWPEGTTGGTVGG